MSSVWELAKKAKSVAATLAASDKRNRALLAIAAALRDSSASILEANAKDIEVAKEKGISDVMLDRLSLNEKRIEDMAVGVEQVAALADPLGEIISEWTNVDGLQIKKVRVPFGVIGMIYEARPNVTVDAAALCLKTGNAALLRGSYSAINSNRAITAVIRAAIKESGIPEDSVQLIESADHSATDELMRLRGIVDLLIPRGGAGLIKNVVENSHVPVIETGSGNCHVYIHEDGDVEMAKRIVINAKTQRPSVCNAIESLLIHEKWLPNLKELVEELQEKGVECRGCEKACAAVSSIIPASEDDWGKEYLDYIISIKVVSSVEEAVEHINRYGTKHSESIITASKDAADYFKQFVDAAAVYHNASTRFTDGFVFGFGAEIGISTQKLHARGPMGLVEMTSYKYCIEGSGQVRG